MSIPVKNLATQTLTNNIAHQYATAIKPFIDSLAAEANALLQAKKHLVIYTKEDKDVSPLAPFVQAVLTFHYRISETKAWKEWHERRKREGEPTEEPVRFTPPFEASMQLVVEGLPGGTLNHTIPFRVVDYNGNFKLEAPATVQLDWGLALGGRHYAVTKQYLQGLTLAALKGTIALEMVEPDPTAP